MTEQTISRPQLLRPIVVRVRLRDGSTGIRISAADQSVLVSSRHLDGFFNDLDDATEQEHA